MRDICIIKRAFVHLHFLSFVIFGIKIKLTVVPHPPLPPFACLDLLLLNSLWICWIVVLQVLPKAALGLGRLKFG